MDFLKTKSLNKKIILLTLIILVLGSFTRVLTNKTKREDIKGMQSNKIVNIEFIPLEKNYNISDIKFISLREYEDILEMRTIQELYVDTDPNFDKKVGNIEKYMNGRNSPLAKKAWYIVALANKFKIDYRLVTAISIIESSGGTKTYRPYNAWGWGGAEGITFNSWEHSIYTVTKGIAVGYYQRGATTPQEIAPSYNPHTPNEWGAKVELTMNQIGRPL